MNNSKAWTLLVIGGFLEVGWAVGLKYAHGFTDLKWTLITLVIMVFSFYCFGYSLSKLEIGTAYAIYTGIGAVGTVLYGVFFLQEDMSLPRILFLILLIGSILGLKLIEGGDEV
ncbi:DMT family transporter [Macrococcus carouselicus]|uniref:Multidrug efflux SMR transporter n=1 Tax=Macrococcus carouselicus TaxID=69969 RepID=A0A9Q8CKW4_9STAP|nr:multidrug efflux SMR transporter [Macrococcus carouselicus]TDM00705.1 multidrug efflux SMR transporter [Macrococcus carouselicus]